MKLTCACRFRVPFKNFVVVSDPKLIPAILGRPGLPKTQMYKLCSTVSVAAGSSCACDCSLSSLVNGCLACSQTLEAELLCACLAASHLPHSTAAL